MQTLKDSWFMIRGDLRGDKIRIVITTLFSIVVMSYLAGLMGLLANSSVNTYQSSALADYLLLATVPILGFTYSRRAIKYWREDPYTRMLAYLRSLPIPLNVVMCRRKLQSVICFALNGTLFFGLIYTLAGHLRDSLSPLGYVVFSFTWIGYGLAVTGLYIFIEFLYSGKAYFWLVLLMMLIAFGGAMLVKFSGGNLLFYSISCSKEWGLLSPLMWGTLLVGTVSVQLFSKWTIVRLKSRDLV
ncbi:hypothetical protein SAMN04487895_12310 [Paenibacillus sophorae]|uniref:ABC-2 family transporter protein n=1 Tax=Paenibacillus sophorae TaxID=1333845 RepID=A0A1H8VC26_9BACL|nr:hypothetical protein [Paenibacillus sophorae]QWU16695.1 hypothetical protein KP014_05610 [Paenibacillus sophorae]SEP13042.1 hypothetical protein SAMN04487895_12310 [Paenibacillus sophorae]